MPADPLAPESLWARLKHAVKVIAVLLGITVAALALLVLAWTSMNLGTFICFGLVVAWIIYHERMHYLMEDSLAVGEKRIQALEEHAGIRRAYVEAVKSGSELQGMFKGTLSGHILWPSIDDLARWRREHWAAWSARYETLAANPVYDETAQPWRALEAWEKNVDELWDQRPYLPPPDGDDNKRAYWSDAARWQPKRGEDLDDGDMSPHGGPENTEPRK